MPASRSRTAQWRRSMEQVFERGGTLEVAVAPAAEPRNDAGSAAPQGGGDLVWRLKILALEEDSVVVEPPVVLGKHIPIEQGVRLCGAITIGQNRWKFLTEKVGECPIPGSRNAGLRLRLPDEVERCMRRHPRYEVGGLNLPRVRVWPLLDPRTVVDAEKASDAAWEAHRSGGAMSPASFTAPTVGPEFPATLVNIGGGGAGLRVESADAGALGRHRVFWMEIALGTHAPLAVCATGKLVHTHLDSAQRTYAGLSFDFTFNLPHQQAVAEQIALAMRSAQAPVVPAQEP